MDSILTSTKKVLGLGEEYTHFDDDLIMMINTAFGVLTQLGCGPANGFYITDVSDTWSDFLGSKLNQLQMVKSYVHFKVKMMFDPPATSPLIESANNIMKELEWRINLTVGN